MRQRLQWIVPLLCLLLLVGLVPARGYAEDDTIVISVEDESETETVSIDELNGEMDSVFDVDQLWPEEEREDLRSFSGEYAWLMLDINLPLLEQVGHQRGGQACACYSLAYCRTLLDGETHSISEFNLGTSENDAWCDWTRGDFENVNYVMTYEVYERMYRDLCAGKPSVILVRGPLTVHHYIAVVGFENVVPGEPLTPWNFLILDPCAADYMPENMGARGFSPKRLVSGSYQLVCDTSKAASKLEAHRSSYLSRCSIYSSSRELQVRRGTVLCSLPCSTKADREACILERIYQGEFFTATALVKNPTGEYWYRGVSSSGTEGYCYAGCFAAGEELFDGTAALNIGLTAQKADEPVTLGGKLCAGRLEASAVICSVYPGADTEGEPLLSQTIYGDIREISLAGSRLSSAAALSAWDDGWYTCVISLRCLNYYSTDGKTLLCSETEKRLASVCFYVGQHTVCPLITVDDSGLLFGS